MAATADSPAPGTHVGPSADSAGEYLSRFLEVIAGLPAPGGGDTPSNKDSATDAPLKAEGNAIRAAVSVGSVKAAPLRLQLRGMSREDSKIEAMEEEKGDKFFFCCRFIFKLRSDCTDMQAGRLLGAADLVASQFSTERTKFSVTEAGEDAATAGGKYMCFRVVGMFGESEARSVNARAQKVKESWSDPGAAARSLSCEVRASMDTTDILSVEKGKVLDLDMAAAACVELDDGVLAGLARGIDATAVSVGEPGRPADVGIHHRVIAAVRGLRGTLLKLRYESLAKFVLAVGGLPMLTARGLDLRRLVARWAARALGMGPSRGGGGGGGGGGGSTEAVGRLLGQIRSSVESLERVEAIFPWVVLRAEAQGLKVEAMPSPEELQEAAEAMAEEHEAREAVMRARAAAMGLRPER